MGKRINIIGQNYGKLFVVKETETGKQYTRFFECVCSCGVTTIVSMSHLRSGHTTSCGCTRKLMLQEGLLRKTHGQSKTKLYKVWGTMLDRCQNKAASAYLKYGARGITVCKEWQSFENFYSWALGNNYTTGLTIDRINVYEGYTPENCRWIPISKQGINKRKPITNTSGYCGVSYKTSLNKWSARITIKNKRINLGYFISPEDANKAIKSYLVDNNLIEELAAYEQRIYNQ